MATEPIRHPGFGRGLQLGGTIHQGVPPATTGLFTEADEDGGAQIAGYNMTSTELSGGVRTRPGTGWLLRNNYVGRMISAWPYYGGVHVICGVQRSTEGGGTPNINGVEVFNMDGTFVAYNADSSWGTYGTPIDCYEWVKPDTTTLAFLTNRRETFIWNGTTFSKATMTGLPFAGRYVNRTPWSSRLVMARLPGFETWNNPPQPGGNPCTVRFSELDAPTTWGTDDWVDLPLRSNTGFGNETEHIIGMEVWEDYLFVITNERLFVFYGESTDAQGVTEFHYRILDSPGRFHAFHVNPHDGLILYGEDGVWATTGSTPRKISRDIDGWFSQGTPSWPAYAADPGTYHRDSDPVCQPNGAYFRGADYIPVQAFDGSDHVRGMLVRESSGAWQFWGVDAERLFVWQPTKLNDVTVTGGFNDGMLCFLRPEQQAAAGAPGPQMRPMFAFSASLTNDAANTTAGGANAIDSWYHSGWQTFGSTNVKSVRELKLTGRGTVNVALATDHQLQTAPAHTVTFGTSRNLETRTVRGTGVTTRGTYIALAFRSVDGTPFQVKDATYMVRATRSHGTNRVDRT